MYAKSQGRRLGAAGGGHLIGTAHAGAVEFGLDLLHALLQPLPFCPDERGVNDIFTRNGRTLVHGVNAAVHGTADGRPEPSSSADPHERREPGPASRRGTKHERHGQALLPVRGPEA